MGLVGAKQDWPASKESFRRFLVWLDESADSGGVRYLEFRQRLVAYFERRHCAAADELADETLNRVARRLEEEGTITDAAPAQYCYIVARYVFLEYTRQLQAQTAFAKSAAYDSIIAQDATAEAERKEMSLVALEECLTTLATGERDLILEYYRGEQGAKIEHRQALARRLGLTANALTIRACRLRDRLERCVRARLASQRHVSPISS
jgi:hypothetical protein